MGRESGSRAKPAIEQETRSGVAKVMLIGLVFVGVVCQTIGWFGLGLGWREGLSSLGCLATGISFVAIALLEIEWLERIIGVFDGVFSGLIQWFWTSEGSLSDSLGRRNAAVIWMLFGVPLYIAGCTLALRIIGG